MAFLWWSQGQWGNQEGYGKMNRMDSPQTYDIDGFVQDWSNSSALAMELLQSCTKPWI